MRSNKRKDTKPCHIVSAWRREDGYCLGQKAVEEKSNEIMAILKVLESIEIKGRCNNRCNGNPDSYRRNNTKKTGRLCAGGKGKFGRRHRAVQLSSKRSLGSREHALAS